MAHHEKDLKTFVDAVVNDPEVRQALQEKDHTRAFHLAKLPPPTPEQVAALAALGVDWTKLQSLAGSFGASILMN